MVSPKLPWPAHPQPLPDEVFSSWIVRAAMCNGQKLRSFLTMTAPTMRSVSKSIDTHVSDHSLKQIAFKMKTDYATAYQTTMQSYQGYLFEKESDKSYRKQCVLSLGETRNDLNYQQYCPLCLNEKNPYYRKRWRISFITVCEVHHCKLLDNCYSCRAPVKVIGNDQRKKSRVYAGSFTACHCCASPLENAPVALASPVVINDTKKYINILTAGFAQLCPERWIYSFSFFAVLRHMMRLTLEKTIPTGLLKIHDVDALPIDLRYYALTKLPKVFSNWPGNLLKISENMGISFSDFSPLTKTTSTFPYWLDEAVRPKLYNPNIEPTQESIHNAIKIMLSKGMKINITTVNLFMGYRDSEKIKTLVKKWRKNNYV
ncbi:TniQ family protein [Motilimonas cestriensis]|uniref:TniQ family protein n=1 Tax=Motilimonas cestriensis TaxID=2742685 RepID=A0ABS8W8M4_9GAMM|nr:TniQ family protein [Motilimonas cestriensis]MCE2594111.1 TniQ family protein [Motilimonas cestriensis]